MGQLQLISFIECKLVLQWWERERGRFDIFISEVVLEEARSGDREAATRRLDLLKGIPLLKVTDRIEEIVPFYMKE